MVRLLIWIVFGLSLASMFSCQPEKENFTPLTSDYSFFPLRLGQKLTYQVDTIAYQFGAEITRNEGTFYLREIYADTFRNASNDLVYRIVREKTLDTLASVWKEDTVMSAFFFNNKILKLENNKLFVKLIFPFDSRLQWNGNGFNPNSSDSTQLYRFLNINQPFQIAGKVFPNTVTVQQFDDSSCVGSTSAMEVYAKNIGMIYKERKHYDLEDGCTSRIINGYKYTFKLIRYE